MRKPRKVAIYKARGEKLRTSGIVFDEEFETSMVTGPAKNRIGKEREGPEVCSRCGVVELDEDSPYYHCESCRKNTR